MCGKIFERFPRSSESQAEYRERAVKKVTRGMLAGANKFPKYPPIHYKPELSLFGMQNVGKLYFILLG